MMIPMRNEAGHIIFEVSKETSVQFDPDGDWVEIQDKSNHSSAMLNVSDVARLIECLKRIDRMVSE